VGLQIWGGSWENIFTIKRTYVGNAIATEQSETWGWSLPDGHYADYQQRTTENSYDNAARLQRSIVRKSYLESPDLGGNYVNWESTDYTYCGKQFTATTRAIEHYAGAKLSGPQPPPELIEIQDFVVDALGKVIQTRDWPLMGDEKDVTVTFHPNGVEKSERWIGVFHNTEMGQTLVFDESGKLLQDDKLAGHGDGRGMYRWLATYSYDGDHLAERQTEYSWHSGWTGDPLGNAAVTVETYRYDGGRLAAIDSIENDESCTWELDGQAWVAKNCTWTAGPVRHTAFGYDAYGNLIKRIVADGAGAELSRWTAVADKDDNLLCELQTDRGSVSSFSRYDYGCW